MSLFRYIVARRVGHGPYWYPDAWRQSVGAAGSVAEAPIAAVVPRRNPYRSASLVVGAVGLGLLAGCSDYFLGPVGAPLEHAVGDASSPVTVDFDRLYSGSWDRLLLVCDGSTSDEIEDALGYPWPQVADVAEGGFVLAGDTVVGAYESGDTTASREPWVYPCPLPGERDGVDVRVVVLPRDAAQVTFVATVKYAQTNHPRTVWSIAPDEYRALADSNGSGD